MAIFVSQIEAKSQTHEIVKSQNPTDFLRFRPNFFSHVKSIYIPECIHKFSRSKNNLAPFYSIRVLRAPPPMNLSGPGGPWQIGLKAPCHQMKFLATAAVGSQSDYTVHVYTQLPDLSLLKYSSTWARGRVKKEKNWNFQFRATPYIVKGWS